MDFAKRINPSHGEAALRRAETTNHQFLSDEARLVIRSARECKLCRLLELARPTSLFSIFDRRGK